MKPTIRLNREIADEHLKVLKFASEAWFYGYNWNEAEQIKLDSAMHYFNNVHTKLKRRTKGTE